ncbi:hypothetical protein [uncultured Sulfitobacter sp.]|uniref:hypothetical protein n=1 Tax=uncultured Sulfitobacter sp. TaxID=191468 RepID=UPI0026113ADA|nr:hypothetical protein [uncultured Sulfitobacter sp.]
MLAVFLVDETSERFFCLLLHRGNSPAVRVNDPQKYTVAIVSQNPERAKEMVGRFGLAGWLSLALRERQAATFT